MQVNRFYSGFRGVDFRGEEVNLLRSPDSVNMWRDYRDLHSIRTRPSLERLISFENPVESVVCFQDEVLAASGGRLYKIKDGEIQGSIIIETSVVDAHFVHDDKIYLLMGSGIARQYKSYDGTMFSLHPYIPTTSIGRKPSGGGTPYEDVNMLTDSRINTFSGDGVNADYYLDAQNCLSEYPLVTVDGVTMNPEEDFMWYPEEGRVNFADPPEAPATDGQDNVVIEFIKDNNDIEKIENCTIAVPFDNRVFFGGNPDYPNTIWHSKLDDPTYVSDKDYYQDGLDEALITGMVPGNNALWVLREPSPTNTNIFYHVPVLDDEYGKVYPSNHSSISTGCIGGATNFNDDIVFLSGNGLEGINGDITTEQAVGHRSSLVDRKLIPKGKPVATVEWEGYMVILYPDCAFVADSRAKFQNGESIEYEWFYWDMERTVYSATVHDGVLYLGCEDGVYTMTGAGDIDSWWTTAKDRFDYPNRQKTTNKRGCVCEATGDVDIYARVEDEEMQHIASFADVADYCVPRIKRKKFKDIQLQVRSATRFSLESITLESFIGGYIKR